MKKIKGLQEIQAWRAQFKSAELEAAYRKNYYEQYRLQASINAVLFFIFNLLFIYADLEFFEKSNPTFYTLLLIRFLASVFSLIYIILLRKSRTSKQFDWLSFLLIITVCSCTLYVDSTRPPSFLFHLLTDITIIFAIYIFFPMRLHLQIISTLLFSLGLGTMLLTIKDIPHTVLNGIWVGLFFSNFFGLWLSWEAHINTRTQFYLLRHEKQLSEKLQEALNNIKVLEGLLPICSVCKKVRDENGDWHDIATYIRNNTDAECSHSICPTCGKKLYPEIYAKRSS